MQTEPTLFDRELELDRLESVIAADRGGCLAYVEAHPGMGKTTLLDVLRDRGEEAGRLVLGATGEELERGFGFGVVRQLFERTVTPPTGPVRLTGAAASAEVAFGRDALSGVDPDSPLPVLHGLYWMVAGLAAERPILLLVDDAQWADLSSLRFLDYLAARIDELPVGLIVASRPVKPLPGDDAEPASVLLTRIRGRSEAALVQPRPLGLDATAAILRRGLGEDPDPGFTAACRAASAGNPFFLAELVEAIASEGLRPAGDETERVGELAPGSVARSVERRVAGLPPAAELVLGAVAVLDSQADSARVAALTGLSLPEVSRLADALARVNLLIDDRPLRFLHPIVRQAVYLGLPAGRRAELHRSAAKALIGEGAAAEGVGPHLLLTEPAGDPEVVAMLREAAAAATGEGEPDRARIFLERARVEPAGEGARAGVLGELGKADVAIGRDLDRGCELLEAAANLSEDSAERVAWIEEAARGRLHGGDLEAAVALLRAERSRLGPVESELRLRLIAHEAGIGVLRPAVATESLGILEEIGDLPGESPAELAALAELGGRRWQQGRIAEAADLARRALSGGRLLAVEGPGSVAFNHAIAILIDADDHGAATEALAEGVAMAGRRGSSIGIASLIPLRVLMAWRRGDLSGVVEEARIVIDLLEESQTPMVDPSVYGYLAAALVERGEPDAAERALRTVGDPLELPPLTFLVTPFLASAKLELARSRPERALATLLALEAQQDELGVAHMSVPWGYVAVEAAVASGRDAAARGIADRQLERASRWGLPSVRGLALVASGLAARGEEGVALMTEGVDLLARSPARLDLARAAVDLGAMLRRQGRRVEAREQLRRGLQEAAACGASVLAGRARRELETAGARPRRLQFSGAGSLTAAERRVAELAASGASNREIAASLFISVRTVENHLGRCYRKLGIGSRRELGGALGLDLVADDPTPQALG